VPVLSSALKNAANISLERVERFAAHERIATVDALHSAETSSAMITGKLLRLTNLISGRHSHPTL